MPIGRSVIANFESGRRATISVAELIAFASALRVPPVALVYPCGYLGQVEGIPGSGIKDPYELALWFTGESNLHRPLPEAQALRQFRDLMRVVRELEEAVREAASLPSREQASLEAQALDVEVHMARAQQDDAHMMMVRLQTKREISESELQALRDAKARADYSTHRHVDAVMRRDTAVRKLDKVKTVTKDIERLENVVATFVASYKKMGWVIPQLPEAANRALLLADEMSRRESEEG